MIYREKIQVDTIKRFTDITKDVQSIINNSNISNGICSIFSKHTTCGIKVMENEILSLADIMTFLETIIPDNKKYQHDRIDIRDVPLDERINAVSHIRMLCFPTSETIPIENNKLLLGKWQTVFLAEMDYGTPFRKREIIITVFGE